LTNQFNRRLNANDPIENFEDVALTRLDGVSIWIEARLIEENVENIESMATAPIEQLVIGTHFPVAQIVDWVDQAILYMHAGDCGQWFPHLRAVGIRTASDLLDAAVKNLERFTSPNNPHFAPDPCRLKRIVKAVRTAPPYYSIKILREGIQDTTSAEGTSQTNNHIQAGTTNAWASSVEPPQLTTHILYVICETIWPDPNMPYILNYYRQMKEECASSTKRDKVGHNNVHPL
jgi:hypothetical protein